MRQDRRVASAIEMLANLGTQRKEWIGDAAALLGADARVAAVWLAGSEGSGRTDELSDFDLFVAVGDRARRDLNEVHNWLDRFGQLLWRRETPRNAPADGRYIRATYEMDALCLFVDWYFQPAATAILGSDVKILFDRVGLPHDRERTNDEVLAEVQRQRPVAEVSDWRDQLEESLGLFWLMVPVIAKYIARGWDHRAQETINWLAVTVDVLCEDHQVHTASGEPLSQLIEMAEAVERVHALLSQRGVIVPPHEHATAWLGFADELIRTGWRSDVPPKP